MVSDYGIFWGDDDNDTNAFERNKTLVTRKCAQRNKDETKQFTPPSQVYHPGRTIVSDASVDSKLATKSDSNRVRKWAKKSPMEMGMMRRNMMMQSWRSEMGIVVG
jgi:hypothetical protein